MPRSRTQPPVDRAERPRRMVSVRHAFTAGLVGYALAALLNAPSLEALARRQELGPRRTLTLRAVAPLVHTHALFRLDRLRSALDRRLHPPESESLPLLPPATPEPAPPPLALPPAALPSTAPALALPSCRPPPARRTQLWIVGDSMAAVFGRTLATLANQTSTLHAAFEARPSTGLTRPDLFDWPARVEQIEETHRPDVTVFVFGANDTERLEFEHRPVSVDTPEWTRAYADRVARLMSAATTGGRRALWVGMPPMRLESFSRHMRALNELFRSEAARHPGVTFVDTWSLFAPPEGGYRAYLPDESGEARLLRETDGIHFTRPGAARLAAAVFPLLRPACEGAAR